LTTGEVAWLDALEKLDKQMAGVTSEKPDGITPAAMTKLAWKLRGCSRGLARAGSPGARLRPAYAQAKAGCQAFDKGARCLVTAAGIGVPPLDSPDFQKLTDSFACVNTSLEKGLSNLDDAQMAGDAIRVEAG
jgi:hypothetical protein